MAVDKKEQRKIEIIADGKKVNASLKELQASSRVLYNQLSKLPKGSDEFVKKSAELKQVNKRMGEVKNEISGTTKSMGDLKNEFVNMLPFSNQIQQFSGAFGAVSGSVGGATKATKLFKVALASTGIGLMVVALGSLIAYLSSTQEGMDKVTSITRPLKAVFQVLLGVVQQLGKFLFNNLGKGLDAVGEAVKNPKEAFMDFVEFIKNNLMNRIKAVGQGFQALKKIMSGDVAEGFKDLGNAAIQGYTGIEGGIDKIQKAYERTSEAINDIGNESKKAIETALGDKFQNSIQAGIAAGKELDRITKQIEQSEINLTTSRAKLRAEFEKYKEAAQDQSRSEEERLNAAQKAQAAQNELLSQEQAFLDQKIKRMELEHALNDTSREDEQELANLVAQRTEFEVQAARKRASAKNLENTVAKQIHAEELARQKEIEKAEAEKQAKLAKLREEYNASRQATDLALQELRIAAIQDETERELAEIDFKHEQEILKIQEQREKLLANEAITEEQKQAQLAMFREQEQLLEQEREAKKAEKLAAEREKELSGEMAHLEEKQQMELLKLQEGFLKVEAAEDEEYKARLALEREFAEEKLRLLEKQGKGETLEAQKLKNEILSIKKEQAEGEMTWKDKVKKFNDAINSSEANAARDTLGQLADFLGRNEQLQKKHAKKIQALRMAEVTLAGIQEVASIWMGAAQLGPIAGPIVGAIQTGLAVGRTLYALNEIRGEKFAEGGATGSGKVVDMLYNAKTGQYSWSGGKVKDVGTFASGGNVNSASTGLIGEKGAEWVAPNWMMKSPAYADTIGWLESERQRKGMKAFATGGATAAASAPSIPTSMRNPQSNQMQNEMMSLRKDFAKLANEISRWPRELRVVNSVVDQRNKMRQLNEIENESRINRSA